MKLCIISDTHGKHKQLDLSDCEADVIIHCGDVSNIGRENEIKDFLNWFSKLNQFKHKIFIAGNHDFYFDNFKSYYEDKIPKNVIYLEDCGVLIDGLFFYGTPYQKQYGDWAFNLRDEALKMHYNTLPEKIDILITHTPPLGILDAVGSERTGTNYLYENIMRIKPKINCFGHIHEQYGVCFENGVKFINASILNEKYEVANKPIIVEV